MVPEGSRTLAGLGGAAGGRNGLLAQGWVVPGPMPRASITVPPFRVPPVMVSNALLILSQISTPVKVLASIDALEPTRAIDPEYTALLPWSCACAGIAERHSVDNMIAKVAQESEPNVISFCLVIAFPRIQFVRWLSGC